MQTKLPEKPEPPIKYEVVELDASRPSLIIENKLSEDFEEALANWDREGLDKIYKRIELNSNGAHPGRFWDLVLYLGQQKQHPFLIELAREKAAYPAQVKINDVLQPPIRMGRER